MSVFSNIFYMKPIYKNLQSLPDDNTRHLNSTFPIANKVFLPWSSSLILINKQEMDCKQTFILCKTSLVLKKKIG